MGKKVVHDIPPYFFIHNSSPPINLHPQHLAIIFIWGRRLCTTFPPIFSSTTHHRQLTPTTSRHHLYMGKKVVHDIPPIFSSTTHHRQSTYTHNISPSSLYGEEGCARHSPLFFHPQLITANQLTPTTYRHHLYMGKKVVHDIPPYFFIHNSSPPINLHPQHLAIIFIWGRRLCTTLPPIFSSTTHHRQSTYTHNISPSSLYGEEGCARHCPLFFHPQLITANQLTPTTYRHHLYMGKKVVHDIPPIFSSTTHHRQSTYTHNISPSSLYGEEGCARHSPLFFHPQLITANQLTPTTSRHHLYMGKKVVHDIPPIFSSTTHHRQSTYTHNISPSSLYGEEGCARHSPLFFHPQLITANQLTPTTSRHHLYMGKKVVHDIPPYFFIHNSSPPINLHPQHLAIIFIWGRRLCTTFPPIFSSTTHHRQSTYTHNISPSSLYGEEGCARHSPLFFHPQLITANQLTPTTSRHHLYMGKKVVHDIAPYFFIHNSSPPINLHPQHVAIIFIWGRRLCTTLPPIFSSTTHHRQSTYTHNISPSSLYGEAGCARHCPLFFIHNSSPPINLHPQHIAIIFIWGRRLCTTLPPIFSSTTHHRQSTYTHNISPSSLYGEEGCARHCPLFFHPQLISSKQLTHITYRHHLYMGKKVVHDIAPYFFIHNSSPPINLHPQHIAIIFIRGRRLCTTFPPIFSSTTHHRQSTYTHNISPSSLYGEEGCARHCPLFFHPQLITANQLTPTTYRHHLYMGKKVVHDIAPYFFIHNSSPPINLHPQHIAIIFIWGRRLCTTFPPIFSSTTHHRQSTYTHKISPSSLYGEEGCARHSPLFFHPQLITANQLTPTTSRHHLYMGKKVVHDIPPYFFIHNSSPPINLHPQHLAIIFIWGRRLCTTFPPIFFSSTTHHRQSTYTHNISPSSLYGEEGCARHSPLFFHPQLITANQLTPTTSRHHLYMGKKVVHDIPPYFFIHNSSPPINLHTHNISPSSLYGEEGCARHFPPIFSSTTHHRQSTYTHNISPSSLYGEEGCARHSPLFFHPQLITANQLTPTTSRHHLYMGKKVVHDTAYFFINSSPNQLTPTTSRHHLMGEEEGCARHSPLFFHPQLITANQLTPTTSRHHLYMGKKVVHDIPTYFFIHNSSPPINLHPQHLAIIFIWGRRLCTTFPPIFSSTTHHRQSTYTHNISPSSLYGEEGCARHRPLFVYPQLITANQLTPTTSRHHLYMGKKVVHDIPPIHNSSPPINFFLYMGKRLCTTLPLFFHPQLITANQLTPTTSRHHLYMGKKVVHDIPPYFFIHNSSPPINLHPQHLAIIFIWGRRLCTTFPPIFSSTTHHRQSTYTHNISPSSLYGEEGCARHSPLFFHPQLITANQLTPTTSRHHLYMGKKVVHDIPPYFFIHNSSPPINLHPQHLAIIFMGKNGEEGCARHSQPIFSSTTHHFFITARINLHPQHLAIIFIWGRRLCTTFPPIFSSTTHHRQSTYTHNISPSSLYGEEGCARHSPLFFHPQLITANQLTPTTYRHHLYMGKKVVHDIPPFFFHAQLITANQLTPTTSRHHLYMGKKVVHDIAPYFFIHNSSPPINLHPQHIAIIFIWGRRLCTTLPPIFSFHNSSPPINLHPQHIAIIFIWGRRLCTTFPPYFFIHNSSPPINLHPQHLAIIFIWGRRLCTTFPPIFSSTTHHRQSTYTHNISPSSLYGEEGCARHSPLFFHPQLITANQLTPTTSRHHLYMGKKVVHDIPPYFFIHNSSPPINLHPQHLAIIFIWGRRLCTTFPPIFSHNSSPPINLHPQHLAIIFIWGRRLCTTFPPIFSSTTHHRQSTYTHNISPSSLYGEEGCARHSPPFFFHPQLITANQLTPTTSRHHLYMGKKVVHDIPPYFFMHNSSPPINLHPQHLAIIFIWGRRLCTTFPPIFFSSTTHHRQSTYTHNISPSSLYGEEGCARHSPLFFHPQLITANQLTPTTSRHHLYMGKKVVHDIPPYFFIHNSSPPINLHPQHLAIIFIWGRRLCTTFPPIFSSTTHHRQSTYTHNISPSSLYGEEGCARHSPLFFHPQLITANQLTPTTTSRHHLYMGKKVVHDIPPYFFIHNSSPPINLHPQHLAIIFIWGRRRLCTTFPPIFSSTTHHRQSTYTHNISPSSLYGEEGCARICPLFFSSTTHHRQSTYTHNISPSSLYGEEGCARHCPLFFHPQLITANQLTPTTSRHHLYMGKKVVHDIAPYFFIHNSSPPINLHPQHIAIIFIWGRRLCTTLPPIFSSTTHHRQSTHTHNISPSSLYGEEGCARHRPLFVYPQLITANQLTPTTYRHHLYMGKKVVHDIAPYFFIHNSSPPINLHPQHIAIIFIWGRRLCTTLPPIFSSTTHHRQSTYTHNISPSSLYGEEGCARHSPLFFHPQLITANQLTPTTSRHHLYMGEEEGCARHCPLFFHPQLITAHQLTPTTYRHHLYMGKKVVHDIAPYFFIHNSSPPINLHTTSRHHLYMGKKVVHDIAPYFFFHNSSPPINLQTQHIANTLYGEEGCERHCHLFVHTQLITDNQLTPTTYHHPLYMGKKGCARHSPLFFFFSSTTHHRQSTYTHNISPSSLYGEEGCARHSPLFFHPQLITANQLTPTTSRHHLYMGKKVVHDIPPYFFIHNSSPPINLHPQHLAIIFIWGRRLCTTFPPIFSSTTHHRQSTYTHNISPSSLYGEEGCARHSPLFFHAQLITANQLTPTTSRHHLYMGKKVVHDIPPYFFMHNSSPPINLHPQHLAIIFIWGRRLCTTFPPIFFIHNSSPPINLHPQHLAIIFIWGRRLCTTFPPLFFHPQLITANQLTPTTSRHHLYMGKKVVHDIPPYFFIHNSSPPINLHPQHLAIIFIWGRRLCTTFPPIFSCTTHHRQSTYTHNISPSPSSLYGEEGCARHSPLFFHPQLITANQLTPTTSRHHLYMGKKVVHDIPPIFSCTTHHRQSTYTHNISPSSLYGEEGCARHSPLFFHAQLITANQLTPTTSRHHLYMGKKVVHDIPPYFFIHNSSPPINLHPQHLAIIFIWGRRLCTTFPPIFSSTTHHRQSTYTHNISPSSLYGEEGCARHSPLFFHPQLITANQLTPTTSRHHLYMGKKVVHDIPPYFFIHNSSPPINLHPQHLAIIFIWGRRLCTTFPPIFSSTTHHRQSTYTHNISPSSLYGEEGCARHSPLFFHPQLITANQLTPTTSRHHLYMGKKVVHDIPPYFFIHNSSPRQSTYTHNISPSSLWGRKKVVHDIAPYFFIHNSSPPINLHPQHIAIIFIWGRRLCTTLPPIFSSTTHHRQSTYTHNISPSSLYGEEGCARHSPYFFMHNSSPPINLHPQHLAIIFIWGRRLCTTSPPYFFNPQLITANQLTPTTYRHHLYMGKKVVHDIAPYFFSFTTHHRQSTYTHNISPSSLYGEEGCARHCPLFFHAQLITANQLTPTTSRHHLYMVKKVLHDISPRLCTTFPPFFSSTTHHRQSTYTHNISPSSLYGEEGCARHSPYFFIHNSSPPINLHPQHLAIIFIWGRRLCTTFPPIFSSTTHHRQSTYTHNISPSSLYGEEGCARHSPLFFHPQLITANQLTPTTSRHHLYMGKKVVHDIPPYFFMHNSSPPINLHPQHLAIIFIWGRRLCTTFPPYFFIHNSSPPINLHPQHLAIIFYMGKKVVHDIPPYFFIIHNSSPPINRLTYTHNISPSSLYGEEGCARHSPLFFSSTTHHRQSTYTHNISPSSLYGEEGCARHSPLFFSCTTHHRQSTYTHNISPSSLYGEEGCARHPPPLFFHPQLITANQLTPTTSRHHLYMGKKVVHDIPPIFSSTTHHRQSTYTHNISPSSLYGEEGCARHFPPYFFIHNSSPPINLHPQHLAIIFIWGRRLCTTFPPIFSSTTHHRQSTYTHNISPSSLYGEEEGCARHCPLFFHPQLITANQLTPTTYRHHLYMGKKVVHDIPPYFSSTTHHRQSTYTHNISPSSLYGEEGCARHCPLFFLPQLITANQLTPTTYRHHLYMGKKVVHDIAPYFFIHNSSPPINLHPQHIAIIFIWGRREEGCARHCPLFFHPQLITANQLTPTTYRHHLYMGKKVVHDIAPYFFIHNSSPPINLHPQHIAIIFIWGRRLCTTFPPPICSSTTHHQGCARHCPLFFHPQLITANQLTPTTYRHHLYMGKKVVHDIAPFFFIHNSSPPINLHPQHIAIIFIWGRRLCTTLPLFFSSTTHHRQSTYTHNISPSSLYGEEGCARHCPLFFHTQLITANQLTPTTSRHHLYMGKKVVHDIPPIFFSSTTHHRQSTYTHNISPSSLYGEEGCARHSPLFFHAQLITANQLTPTTSRHHLYMGKKKVVHDIPPYFFFIHNSSPPINLHTHNISPSSLYGEEGCARHSPLFFHPQLITANQLTPTTSRHHLYMGKKVVHDIPPYFFHPQLITANQLTPTTSRHHLYMGKKVVHDIPPYFFITQLITANQLTPTTSRHHLYMGKKVVHDIPPYFFIHNSSPPINLHPQHLAIIFIWGRRLCTTFPPYFFIHNSSPPNQLTPTTYRHHLYMGKKVVHDIPPYFFIHNSSPPINTTHHRQSTYTHNISPSSLYGEEGCARHCPLFFHPHNSSPPINLHPQHLAIIFIWGRRLCTTFPPIFSSTTHHRQSTYTHNISPSSLYGEEGCARHCPLFFHAQLITANQLTPTTSRHHLYMGKKVVHDIPPYFFMHNSSPPINLHPQHLAIIFIWGRRLCTTFPPIFSSTTHHRQSTYTHNISPSSLYGEEGCARHSPLFFHAQLITANQLTPTTYRHHLYIGKKVVHNIPPFFFSSTTHHRQSTYTHNISPSFL
ncbi:hypothetical protein KSF78_0009645 [Schistosoma japonicum]|nr:hypothetical protein KSF78_0009645 [Schistosoma japonicum]